MVRKLVCTATSSEGRHWTGTLTAPDCQGFSVAFFAVPLAEGFFELAKKTATELRSTLARMSSSTFGATMPKELFDPVSRSYLYNHSRRGDPTHVVAIAIAIEDDLSTFSYCITSPGGFSKEVVKLKFEGIPECLSEIGATFRAIEDSFLKELIDIVIPVSKPDQPGNPEEKTESITPSRTAVGTGCDVLDY